MAGGKLGSNHVAFLGLLLLLVGLLSRPSEAASNLPAGKSLRPGQSLTRGRYVFIMQQDCNLVLYDGGRSVWSSRTAGKGSSCTLDMQFDGNLVIYNPARFPVWASNTPGGRADYDLVLQGDRNVVIYAPGGRAIWATHTVAANIVATNSIVAQ